jgi:hypothetical protein
MFEIDTGRIINTVQLGNFQMPGYMTHVMMANHCTLLEQIKAHHLPMLQSLTYMPWTQPFGIYKK